MDFNVIVSKFVISILIDQWDLVMDHLSTVYHTAKKEKVSSSISIVSLNTTMHNNQHIPHPWKKTPIIGRVLAYSLITPFLKNM